MARTRGLTLKGPAIITRNSIVYRTVGGIKINLSLGTFEIPSDEAPVIDERLQNIPIEIEFTPVGIVTEAILGALYAPLSMAVGTSLFGETDIPAVITPLTGKEPVTFHCTGFTAMPDIIWSATKTMLGPCKLTAILANGKEWNDLAARMTVGEDVAAPTLAEIDPATIPTHPARVRYGEDSPWDELGSRSGVVASFALQADPDEEDEMGVFDYIHAGVKVSVKLNPVGVNVAQVLAEVQLQGEGVRRGMSLASRAKELVVESAYAGGIDLEIPKAVLKPGQIIYGRGQERFGDMDFAALQTTGVPATVSIHADEDTSGST